MRHRALPHGRAAEPYQRLAGPALSALCPAIDLQRAPLLLRVWQVQLPFRRVSDRIHQSRAATLTTSAQATVRAKANWIRTGDKFTQDVDGFYWYAGRTDDMLKVGGLWVSPVEVENALVAHPAVLECGVVGHQDHDGLVKPMAFVVLRDGKAGSPELATELQQFVRERVAEYKRPRWVEFLPELPKTATGKIQRFLLRAQASEGPTHGSAPT